MEKMLRRSSRQPININNKQPDPFEYDPFAKADAFLDEDYFTPQNLGSTQESEKQESETDTAKDSNIKDSESEIDKHVNEIIAQERAKFDELTTPDQRRSFVANVHTKIGKMDSILTYQSAIEIWVESELGKDYYVLPEQANTKYAGYKNFMWKRFPVLGPSMLVAGTKIGSDKLGHFFHEGYDYFKDMYSHLKKEGSTTEDKDKWAGRDKISSDWGHNLEMGKQGVTTTGVYSYADLAANASGYTFYQDLYRDPSMHFSISHYMNEIGKDDPLPTRTSLSEEINTNLYTKDLAKTVWKNLLNGTWHAPDQETQNNIQLQLNQKKPSKKNPDTDAIDGTFSFRKAGDDKDESLEILDAKITYISEKPFGIEEKEELIKRIEINGTLSDGQKVTIFSAGESTLKMYFKNAEGASAKRHIVFNNKTS